MRFLQLFLVFVLIFSGFKIYAANLSAIYLKNTNDYRDVSLYLSKQEKNCQKYCDSKREYIFVFSSSKLEIKKKSNNTFDMIIINPYPNAMFFSNGDYPRKGGLYTIPFFKKLQKELKNNSKIQMKMRLYPGTSWKYLLAKPIHVQLKSISQIKNGKQNKWVFNVISESDNKMLEGNYVFPDFFIFNSDLPKSLY